MSSLKAHSQTLYETDYLQWIETAVEKLQSQDYANVEWENLIEEIADMGRSERRSFKSNLIVILIFAQMAISARQKKWYLGRKHH